MRRAGSPQGWLVRKWIGKSAGVLDAAEGVWKVGRSNC